MSIYYILLILIYFLGCYEVCTSKKDNIKLSISITFILLFLVGLKSEGGTDFMSYKDLYENINSLDSLFGGIEPLFIFFVVFSKIFNIGYYGFHFFIATINIPAKIYIFRKLTPYICPALLIYCVGLFFERDNDGFRQGLSIAFCYLSLIPLIRGKTKQFIFCNICAVFTHYTSIVFSLIYFIRKVKISDRKLLLCVILVLFMTIIGFTMTPILSHIMPSGYLAIKLQQYTQSDIYSASSGINIGILFRLIILFLFVMNHKRLKIDNDLYYILRNGFAFAICVSLFFSDFSIFAHRLPYSFRELQILIAPYFLTIVKGPKNRFVVLTIIFFYALILLWRISGTDNAAAYNYNNLLFEILE